LGGGVSCGISGDGRQKRPKLAAGPWKGGLQNARAAGCCCNLPHGKCVNAKNRWGPRERGVIRGRNKTIISSKLDQRTRNPLSSTTKFRRAEELGCGQGKPYRRGEAAVGFMPILRSPQQKRMHARWEERDRSDSGEESLILADTEPGGNLALITRRSPFARSLFSLSALGWWQLDSPRPRQDRRRNRHTRRGKAMTDD